MANSDRRQRVRLMRVVFAGLAVLCLAGWIFVRTAGATTATEATDAAAARASGYASSIARATSNEGQRLEVAQRAANESAQDDASVARVRVWDPAGTLVASTDPQDRAGKARAGAGLRPALRGETTTADVDATFTPLAGGHPSTGTLTEVFVPLSLGAGAKPAGAVEVDFVRAQLVSVWWLRLSIALAAGVVIFAMLFVFFMTRKVAPVAEPLKKVAPPPTTSPKIAHDFRASKQRANNGWVVPAKDSPPPPTSVADLEAATARIAELEKALQRAADENEQVRSRAASQEQDMERLRLEASERVAALEEQARTDGPEIEALRVKLAEAQSRATEAESLLATAREQLTAAHTQVGDVRASAQSEDVPAEDESPATPEEPAVPEPTDPTDLIAVLEAKVADAEARAQHAKEEAMQLSPEASDLRMRLARTAARKKMGASAG